MKKRSVGRGELKIIEKKQKAQEEERETKRPRNRWYYQAVEKLRQARRCEQAAYRIRIKGKESKKEKEEEYWNLNEAAFAKIIKEVSDITTPQAQACKQLPSNVQSGKRGEIRRE